MPERARNVEGVRRHDLVVLGAGSGNAVVSDAFADLDVAIVEESRFGGTCLNRGCIPTKMFAYAAEVTDTVRSAGRYDVDAHTDGLRWRDARDRVFGRLDPIAEEGRDGREKSGFVTVYTGHARFTGERRLRVDTASGPVEIAGERIVIAAGSRPVVPPVIAESGLPYETSDTVMRRETAPRRLAVVGGGYIAAELAEVLAATGTEIVMIELAGRLLDSHDDAIADAYTELTRRRFDVRLGHEVTAVDGEPGALRITLDDGAVIEADTLLAAVGRVPNGDRLDLDRTGVTTHDDGRIVVDAEQRTVVPGVYALGDVCTSVPLKHVANREAHVVAHNLLHPDDPISTDHDVVPSAVFTCPQIASVGRTEQACRAAGLDYTVGTTRYADVAFGWAMEDETGFCKVIAERGTGRLLGAHLLGPQAATLVQPLVLAMTWGVDARTLADSPYWIHPALTEVVENALRALDH